MATRALRKDAGLGKGEGPKHSHVFREFHGINTQAARQAIQPGEFSWIENIMPIGHGNAKVVPHRSASLQSVASGDCYYMADYNIDGLNYMFMATDDGHAYQVALAVPYARTQIGSAFSNSGLQIAQWKNERILIVDPVNGFFTWDGTLLAKPGFVVAVTVTAGGAAYTAIPTITFTGGGGAGAAAFASMLLAGAQTVSVAGTGYTPGDILTLVGGTHVTAGKLSVVTTKLASVALNAIGAAYAPTDTITLAGGTHSVAAIVTVDTVNGGGGILTFHITTPGNYTVNSTTFTQASTTGGGSGATFQTGSFGVLSVGIYDAGEYSALPVAPVATTGGGANNATITPAYAVLSVTVTLGGTVPYSAAPTVVFSSGAAAATAVLLEGPPFGEHVATFSGRAWVTQNRTLNWSAPDSYYDFSGAGSGTKIITDETLHSAITQLISANSFLYYTGVDSVNVIGDVQINTNGDTVFSDTNLSASIGTDESNSPIPYFRSVFIANRSGMYSIYGSTPQKASDALDGIVEKIDFDMEISSGTMFLKNILCAAFLFQYQDALLSVTRPLLAVFFNKKWFVCSQGDDLIFVASGVQGGRAALYGTDGTHLYKLFDDDTLPVSWTFSTAFWDMQDVSRGKQITKFGFEFNLPANEGTVDVTIDALASTPPYSSNQPYSVPVTSAIEWINDADEVVLWTNTSGAVVDWLGSGYFMDMEDGSQFGKYVGLTMASSDVIGAMNSAMLEYTFREEW